MQSIEVPRSMLNKSNLQISAEAQKELDQQFSAPRSISLDIPNNVPKHEYQEIEDDHMDIED